MKREVQKILEEASEKISRITGRAMHVHASYVMDNRSQSHMRLMMVVCREFGVTRIDLEGRGRAAKVIDARCTYAWLAKFLLGDEVPAISLALQKDRATIKYYLKRMGDLLSVSDGIKNYVKRVQEQYHKISITKNQASNGNSTKRHFRNDH